MAITGSSDDEFSIMAKERVPARFLVKKPCHDAASLFSSLVQKVTVTFLVVTPFFNGNPASKSASAIYS